jgi:hypothetical protein
MQGPYYRRVLVAGVTLGLIGICVQAHAQQGEEATRSTAAVVDLVSGLAGSESKGR